MTTTLSEHRLPGEGPSTGTSRPAVAGQTAQVPICWPSQSRSIHHYAAQALLMTALSVAAGCSSEAPQRYDLAGNVTYDGKPVTTGYMTFEPDRIKGNSGPGTAVDIVDGQYATRPGQGTVGGPYVVTISGFDGVPFEDHGMMNPMGRPLFEDIKVEIDVPKEPATRNLELP